MAIFVLDLEDPHTVDSYLDAALANIEIFRENNTYDHCITDFAIPQLKRAIELIDKS